MKKTIIAIIVNLVIFTDIILVGALTAIIESEYGNNEIQQYYNCDTKDSISGLLCIGRKIQKELIKNNIWIIGIIITTLIILSININKKN